MIKVRKVRHSEGGHKRADESQASCGRMRQFLRLRASWLLLVAFCLASVFRLVLAQQTTQGTQQTGSQPGRQQGPLPGQNPSSFLLRTQTNLVLVDVRVRDKKGNPINNLQQGDFKIFEDGVPQTISSFSL